MSNHQRKSYTPAKLMTIVSVIVAIMAALVANSFSAGAATQPISGAASLAVGFSGTTVGVPQTSTFTGTLDSATGAVKASIANVAMDLLLPVGSDTYGFTGTVSNPGSFTGNVTGSNVSLIGTARFTLTGFTIPGVTVPPILGILGCNLDFVPHFSGTYDEVAGTIAVSDDTITVPQFPSPCAGVLNTAISAAGLDFDINKLLAASPPATASLSLDFDRPVVTTTSSTTSTSASTSTTTATTTPTTSTSTTTATTAPTTSTSTTTATTAPTTSTSTTTATTAPTTSTPTTTATTAPTSTTHPLDVTPAVEAATPVTAQPNYTG